MNIECWSFLYEAQISTGFSPHNMLECKGSQELQRFADKKIRPASGSQSAVCVAEISTLLQLIQGCFPVPASRLIQVIRAPSPLAGPCSPKEAIPFSWRWCTSTGQGHMFKGQLHLLCGVIGLLGALWNARAGFRLAEQALNHVTAGTH